MESSVVVERLGLGPVVGEWLAEAERLPDPGWPLRVPVGVEAAAVLDMFGLADRDRAEVEALWPGDAGGGRGGPVGEWSPELWHVVECMYRRLWADVVVPVGEVRGGPGLVGVEERGGRVACLWAVGGV